ncbi:hypothetical protein NQ315_012546 [Exocentrus adspersus]|uniref:Reverse transcriptase domain-containing protein n=1 Tax=Exocentrus adspersus TaxID=1586481 RepID=A0AAV8V512_9CUCU|nr:hypothetical protein NQ315_012546 [Exocentrus adspersus]
MFHPQTVTIVKRNTDRANFRAEMQRSTAIPRIQTANDLEAAVVSLEKGIRTVLERSTTEAREVKQTNTGKKPWKRFVESLNPRDNSLCKTQKALRTRRRPFPLLHGEQRIAHTNRDKAEAFADSLELQCRENQIDDEDEEYTTLEERRARRIGQMPDDEEIPTATWKPESGVRQDTVLSPHLFNIYTSDLPRTDRTSMSLYADDTVLAAQSTEAAMAGRYLQRATYELEEWCNR